MPLPSRNGAAKASLILILISLLGGIAAFWWLTGANTTLVQVVNLVTVALLVAAFILAIVGLVVAVTRPTRKGESVFALIMSSLLLIGVIVLFGLGLVAAGPVDVATVESTIEACVPE